MPVYLAFLIAIISGIGAGASFKRAKSSPNATQHRLITVFFGALGILSLVYLFITTIFLNSI